MKIITSGGKRDYTHRTLKVQCNDGYFITSSRKLFGISKLTYSGDRKCIYYGTVTDLNSELLARSMAARRVEV